MLLCCDFGGSSIKVMELSNEEISSAKFRPVQSPAEFLKKQPLDNYDHIICTGGRSLQLPGKIASTNIFKVPEFEAIAEYTRFNFDIPTLVVSAGTGIPFVEVAEETHHHKGGTSLGGGTLFGLGKRLTGINSFAELEELAVTGDPTNVNLTVGDIVGSGIGILPPEASASYFSKSGGSKSDIAAALFHMVGEPMATTVNILLDSLNYETAICIGRTMTSDLFVDIVKSVINAFDKDIIIPEEPSFSVLKGAIMKYQNFT